ncbi:MULTISPECIES: hypothetical protein [unclassified Streptomyces]|uniref:hypothetical protein n=1 Tax=unclassified Streptomyces TaxID=2593676 RepID=UPI00382060D8
MRNLSALLSRSEANQTCSERTAAVAELIGMGRTHVDADPGRPRAVEFLLDLRLRIRAPEVS